MKKEGPYNQEKFVGHKGPETKVYSPKSLDVFSKMIQRKEQLTFFVFLKMDWLKQANATANFS